MTCYQYIKGIIFSILKDNKFSGLVSGINTTEHEILRYCTKETNVDLDSQTQNLIKTNKTHTFG